MQLCQSSQYLQQIKVNDVTQKERLLIYTIIRSFIIYSLLINVELTSFLIIKYNFN